jgi:hypothetical protein
MWQWPASFVDINLNRMLELGRVSAEWVGQVRKAFHDAEADERTLMTTPLVIEVIAERP